MNDKKGKECCLDCVLCKRLELTDFHTERTTYGSYNGFACLAFINDNVVRHMSGVDPSVYSCEYFSPKADRKMRNNNDRFFYRGYHGTVEFDESLNCYSGKIVDGWGEYYGCTLDELYEDFLKRVDKYIEWCEMIISNPERRDAWGKEDIKVIKEGEIYKCIRLKNTK